MVNLGNVITAMVTPFDKDLKVDYKAVEKLADHLVSNGTDTILVAGTTGESPTLTHEEEREVLKVVKATIGTRGKILMGAGSNCTQTAVEASKEVEAMGVDAILSVVPYYNKPSQAGMIAHFGAVADAVDTPIMIYNIPGRTGVNMASETICEVAKKHKNIFGVKQSNADLDLVTEISKGAPVGFQVYSGDDSLTLPMLSLGATGVVSVSSHIIGSQINEMITSFKAGDVKKAREIQLKYYPVFIKLFMAPNPTPVKAALAKMGILEDNVRLPLIKLDEAQKVNLFSILDGIL